MLALLKLFLLPLTLSKTSGADEEVNVVDPDDTSYQASFSKLGASERVRPDPVAYVPEPRTYLATSLVATSQAHPGQVWNPSLLYILYRELGLMRLCGSDPTTGSRDGTRVCDAVLDVPLGERLRTRLNLTYTKLLLNPSSSVLSSELAAFSSPPLHFRTFTPFPWPRNPSLRLV